MGEREMVQIPKDLSEAYRELLTWSIAACVLHTEARKGNDEGGGAFVSMHVLEKHARNAGKLETEWAFRK